MITFTKSSGSKSTISFMKRGRDGTSNVVNEGNFRSCFPAQQKHKLVLPCVSLSQSHHPHNNESLLKLASLKLHVIALQNSTSKVQSKLF